MKTLGLRELMFWAQGYPKEAVFISELSCLPLSQPREEGIGQKPPAGAPLTQHLLGVLVAEDLGVVAVQLEDDPVHLLFAQAPMAHQERRVLDQAVTVGLL